MTEPNIIFFKTPGDFRKWLEGHHKTAKELWVGYFKKKTGKPSMIWEESVDQALCFGWIDGIRKNIDEESFRIRFTPRKRNSHWSRVNVEKVDALRKQGLMMSAGLEAFSWRKEENTARTSFEQSEILLEKPFEKKLRANKKAWKFFQSLSPYVQRQSIWYVMQAKQEATRLKRLNILIECCEQDLKIPPMRYGKGDSK
jgi:uncharacterized protein YdeI (YjbR/CyaY-like superfamily)